MPIMPMLGRKAAATAGTIYVLCVAVATGAIFGVFAVFLLNPVYHWFTGAWVDSVVYELAVSFWAALFALGCLRARIKEAYVAGESRFLVYFAQVVDEFSSAFLLVGFFATLVALGGPFARLAAFFDVFTHGVTMRDAWMMALVLGAMFSVLEIGKLAYRRRRMHEAPSRSS